MNPKQEMGKYLAELRKRRGLTQRDVSAAMGYSTAQYISNFERGRTLPPMRRIGEIVRLLRADRKRVARILIAAQKKEVLRAVMGKE